LPHLFFGRLESPAFSIAQLAVTLSNLVNRNVEDRTGLNGFYDVKLHYKPEVGPLPATGVPNEDAQEPSLFVALEEQLGLELKSVKGTVVVLVIDHIERPRED